ncbi:MAG TPA: cupin domain-containing protein [Candidatus Acidoferrales bacterium]|nr:cupin domain-containing protein [Candidatus Acidoferrales bacterium]
MENFKKLADVAQFAPDKMRKNGIFETSRMFCDLYCFEPGQAQAPHTHEGSDKIYYVVQGKGRFQIGDAEKELSTNEIAIALSGQRHGVANPGPERLMLLVFMAPKPAH